jgi:hypothetical protein
MDFSREDLDKFDSLIKEAYNKPWWRAYIEQIVIRKNDCLNDLADPGSDLNQRQEDRLRGCIIAYNFTLALDDIAKVNAETGGRRTVSHAVPNIQLEEVDDRG